LNLVNSRVQPRTRTVLAVIVCLPLIASACTSRVPAEIPDGPSNPAPKSPPRPIVERARADVRADAVPEDCDLIAGPGEPILTVALSEPVNPANAPRPSNESERLLFRQLYETLVRVDCRGRVRPALASAWRLNADARSWIVSLRDGARFSDGTPVTAADIVASWSRDGAGIELSARISRLVESLVAIDDRTLSVTLRSQRTDVPLALAHGDLAIGKRVDGLSWPAGTRPSRVAAQAGGRGSTAASVITVDRDGLTPVRFLLGARDPRDLLDDGVDLTLTRDPATLGYAGTLSQYQSVPLDWQRVHILVTPRPERSSSLLMPGAREALARDAVRGEARGALGPPWWQASTDCHISGGAPAVAPLLPQIVYDARDHAARDVAERLAGLRTFQRATGLTGETLVRARRRGADAGYLVSLETRPLDPCHELQSLTDGLPWLDPEAIVPLVETRFQAIVRRGRSGISTEWDGGLLLAPEPGLPPR
jgi:hypothetical protein